MVQFYLLSVVANLIAGSMLSVDLLEAKVGAFKGMGQFVRERPKMGLVAGIVAFAVGFFMFITPMRGDLPVVGDLLPAVAGIVMGYSLWLDWFKKKRAETASWPFIELSDRLFGRYRNAIGITGIAIALLHFLVPAVLFL